MNARVLEVAKLLVKEILRKKDFYVAFILTAILLAYAAQLRFYGVSSASRYLIDIGLILSFGFGTFLTVSLAARQYPSDKQEKILHVLLVRPISRWEYLFGKFLGAWSSGVLISLVFFGSIVTAALTKTSVFSWVLAAETFYVYILGLGIVTAMAVLLSLFLTPSATVSIVLSFSVLMSVYGFYWNESHAHLPLISRWISVSLYHLLPHLEFFDLRQRFVHAWPPPSAGLILFLTGYAFFYMAVFLLSAKWLFQRRPIS